MPNQGPGIAQNCLATPSKRPEINGRDVRFSFFGLLGQLGWPLKSTSLLVSAWYLARTCCQHPSRLSSRNKVSNVFQFLSGLFSVGQSDLIFWFFPPKHLFGRISRLFGKTSVLTLLLDRFQRFFVARQISWLVRTTSWWSWNISSGVRSMTTQSLDSPLQKRLDTLLVSLLHLKELEIVFLLTPGSTLGHFWV